MTVNNFVVRGAGESYRVSKHPVVFRALTAEEVEVVMLEVGFEAITVTPDRWELLISAVKPEE